MYVAVSNSGWALRKPRKVIPHLLNPVGFPRGTSGKESACQCRGRKRHVFDPWVRKIPWRKKWQPTSVFLPGKSHGLRILVGCSPCGCKESDRIERLHFHFHFYFRTNTSCYRGNTLLSTVFDVPLTTDLFPPLWVVGTDSIIVCVLSRFSHVWLCSSMDYSPPGSFLPMESFRQEYWSW